MATGFAARNTVAVVGYAHSTISRGSGRNLGALTVDTARAAIADAGLRVEDVDGFVSSSLLPSAGGRPVIDGTNTVSSAWLAQRLRGSPRYVAGFDGVGQLTGSVAMAVNAISSGAADHVLVHRALHNPSGRYHGNPMTEVHGAQQWTAPTGYFGPLAMIALPYNEYLQRYGAAPESMAAVVTEARKNGARIPWSYWHDRPLSTEEYLAAPKLLDPVCRFDCDIPVDGVATFVLSSAERAVDLPHPPVYISGFAGAAPARRRLPSHWPLDDIMDGGRDLVGRLMAGAGVTPAEVDLPQVYDGFSPFVWFWLEVLGLCPPGEAHRFVVDGGIDSDSSDAIPVLSGGGALGNGRMHGIPQLLECYLQLANRAGVRQRRHVHTALACHSSPHYGGAVVLSAEPF
ncbi:thiolase family protein [Gordonia sp. CPCC 206044]|uniref:thiolase family protein n=1 Tax=Gordonia sp. CPCC 206044 TaxID=3140793 RepID=UPI003AF37CCB